MNSIRLAVVSSFSALVLSTGCSGAGPQPSSPDTTAPTVLAVSPAAGATGVARGAPLTVTFSEAMDASTLTTATLVLTAAGAIPVTGTVSASGATATFTPARGWLPGIAFSATVTSGAKDRAGNPSAERSWTFVAADAAALIPAAATPPIATPAEQAAYFIAMLESSQTRLAGWLGLYAALELPVLQDPAGAGSTVGVPFGPPLWAIWQASGLDPVAPWLTLDDAGRLLGASFELTQAEATTVGQVLLADLRAAAQHTDPVVNLLGAFARERILRGPSGADILDPSTASSTAVIDPSTVQLVAWVAVRDAAVAAVAAGIAPPGPVAASAPAPWPQAKRRAAALPSLQAGALALELDPALGCPSSGGGEAAAVINWVTQTLAGGIGYRGAGGEIRKALPSMSDGLLMMRKAEKTTMEKVGSYLNVADKALAFLGLYFQAAAVRISGDQSPVELDRTPSCAAAAAGGTSTVLFEVMYDTAAVPDGGSMAACVASFLLNKFGVGLDLPVDGTRLPNVRMMITPRTGVPDLVHFAVPPENRPGWTGSYSVFTDDAGVARLGVIGSRQQECFDAVVRIPRRYSVTARTALQELSFSTAGMLMGDVLVGSLTGEWANLLMDLGVAGLKLAPVWGRKDLDFAIRDWASGAEDYVEVIHAGELLPRPDYSTPEPTTVSASYRDERRSTVRSVAHIPAVPGIAEAQSNYTLGEDRATASCWSRRVLHLENLTCYPVGEGAGAPITGLTRHDETLISGSGSGTSGTQWAAELTVHSDGTYTLNLPLLKGYAITGTSNSTFEGPCPAPPTSSSSAWGTRTLSGKRTTTKTLDPTVPEIVVGEYQSPYEPLTIGDVDMVTTVTIRWRLSLQPAGP